jgi:hypothetical protein
VGIEKKKRPDTIVQFPRLAEQPGFQCILFCPVQIISIAVRHACEQPLAREVHLFVLLGWALAREEDGGNGETGVISPLLLSDFEEAFFIR